MAMQYGLKLPLLGMNYVSFKTPPIWAFCRHFDFFVIWHMIKNSSEAEREKGSERDRESEGEERTS